MALVRNTIILSAPALRGYLITASYRLLVECGAVGLILMLFPWIYLFLSLWRIRGQTDDFTIDLSIAFISGAFLMAFSSSYLYWEKMGSLFLNCCHFES